MSKILPLIAGGADPVAVVGNAIIFSKVSAGVTEVFAVASDGGAGGDGLAFQVTP